MMPMLGVGGVSRLMSDIIPLLNEKEGIDVEFLINGVAERSFLPALQNAGVIIHELKCSSVYSPLCIFKIAKFIRKYDLIHVHLFPTLYFVAIANLFVGKPLVYTEHNTYNKRRNKWYLRYIEKWIYGRYTKIISISKSTEENLKEWISDSVAANDNRFIVVNNGVRLDSFKQIKRNHIYPHTLIMVSRFAPAKDQMTIIKTMSKLSNDIHLILVGDGVNYEKCKRMAEDINVLDRVHFVGMQSDIPSWLGKADIGIQSSFWEGFGLSAVEMMAAGLPVIASDVEGLRQIVDGAGLLFPCGDANLLAELVNKLFEDKSYYNQVRQKCIERSKCYDVKRMVDAYLDVYKDVLRYT